MLAQRNYRLQVNGREASLDGALLPGDDVIFEPGAGFQERVRDLLNAPVRTVAAEGPEGPPAAPALPRPRS
ncbi:hypothetical protein D3C83_194870 [compost metagenome]